FPEIPQLPRQTQEFGVPGTEPLSTIEPANALDVDEAHNENLIHVTANPVAQPQSAGTIVGSDDLATPAHTESEGAIPAQKVKQTSGELPTPATPSLPSLPPKAETGNMPPSQTCHGSEAEIP